MKSTWNCDSVQKRISNMKALLRIDNISSTQVQNRHLSLRQNLVESTSKNVYKRRSNSHRSTQTYKSRWRTEIGFCYNRSTQPPAGSKSIRPERVRHCLNAIWNPMMKLLLPRSTINPRIVFKSTWNLTVLRNTCSTCSNRFKQFDFSAGQSKAAKSYPGTSTMSNQSIQVDCSGARTAAECCPRQEPGWLKLFSSTPARRSNCTGISCSTVIWRDNQI